MTDERLNTVERVVAVHEVRIGSQEKLTTDLDRRIQVINESRIWTPMAKAAVLGPALAAAMGAAIVVIWGSP